jgi:hypothetical protein
MSARRDDTRRSASASRTEADHDEGMALIMRLTDYLGDARRAAITLVEKHGASHALEVVDRLIADCGENDSPHAVEMGAMWLMVRNHIVDRLDPDQLPKTPSKSPPPARE